MPSRPVPRPASAAAAGYFMIFLCPIGFVQAAWGMNVFQELPPRELLPHLFGVPLICGALARFIFAGKNWARILFWVLALPMAVETLRWRWDKMHLIYLLVVALASVLLAHPNAHWFFTGRDFRRRPRYQAAMRRPATEERVESGQRRGGYEY